MNNFQNNRALFKYVSENYCRFDYKDRCLKTVTRFLDARTIQENHEFIIYYNQGEKDNDQNWS